LATSVNLCNFAQRWSTITDKVFADGAPDACGRVRLEIGSGEITLTIRTTRTTVSFSRPFTLQNLEGVQPAGEYVVLIDDELIEGLSRVAYRRVATLFQTPAISASQRLIQSFSISQTDLDAAIMKDRNQTIVVH
jgi:hypothetical protein